MRVTNVLSWCLLANQFTGTLYQGFVTTLGDAWKGHSGQSNTMHVITKLRFPLSIKDPTVSGKHTSSRRTEETTLSKENCSICNVAHPAPLVPQKKCLFNSYRVGTQSFQLFKVGPRVPDRKGRHNIQIGH